jgi:hypothetical protein
MSDFRPGLNPRRLLNLMEAAIKRVMLTAAALLAYSEITCL